MNFFSTNLMRAGGFALLLMLIATSLPTMAATNGAGSRPPVPPMPQLRSPVESFRTLLVMPSAERRQYLSSRSLETQTKLTEKVREYLALPAEERELRLMATELQWYLKPLLSSGLTNRASQVELIPENVRPLVQDRLAQWDKIPPGMQRLMLTNQHGAEYLVWSSSTRVPPSPADAMHKRLRQQLDRFFELTPGEKEKVLATLSDAERRQMEKSLAAYANLTPRQRQQCLASFARFAGMSATEQQEFLKNTERWAQMSATERQAWRELVSTVPKLPPMPVFTRKQSPPLPPDLKRRTPATTNGG
jgi:hypothetical protein